MADGEYKYLKYIAGEWGRKEETGKRMKVGGGGQGENLYTSAKKCLGALNSNECIELTAQKCEDIFAGMEF